MERKTPEVDTGGCSRAGVIITYSFNTSLLVGQGNARRKLRACIRQYSCSQYNLVKGVGRDWMIFSGPM